MPRENNRFSLVAPRSFVIPRISLQTKDLHWIVAVLLAVFLVPAFHAADLPLRFPWTNYIVTFYWALFFQSMTLATILFAIAYPSDFWQAIAGKIGPKVNPIKAFASVALPGTYLFFVLVLAFSYNDVVARFRFDGMSDVVLNQMDSWLLNGWTVADFSHKVPLNAFPALEAIYRGMFPQIGACLFILAFRHGRAKAMQFIGAVATAYFIALGFFYFVPATGPFYLSLLHPDGAHARFGEFVAERLNTLRDHHPIAIMGTDWFVATPCLHLTQPLIVIWFLRKSKAMVAALVAYDVVLIPSVLLLEQHYVVDLVAGTAVALVAIAMVDWPSLAAAEPALFRPVRKIESPNRRSKAYECQQRGTLLDR
jgi:PAP2 superfamily